MCYVVVVSFYADINVKAQANLAIYTDNLVNGFQDWGWGGTRNFSNTSPTHSGNDSISAALTAGGALSFQHSDFNVTPYASLAFWAHGGTSGGQRLQVYVQYGPGGTNGPAYSLSSALTAGTWTQYTVSLSTLGVANRSDVNRVNIQLSGAGTTGTFYVDDIQFGAAPAPALTHLGVDATQTIRPADARWFGVNTAIWDSHLGNAQTLPLLQQAGCLALRWPGGSTSDTYHWAASANRAGNANFYNLATNLGAQVFITVNYGSGSSNEAAAWVLSANKTNNCGFKYWEIGNECYGTWENDTNIPAHDPYTYAVRAAGYIAAMKAAYTNIPIRVGVVMVPGEGSSSNNATHFAINPRTGTTNYGWTPVMLATLKSLGATPDFAIYHFYPEYTPTGVTPVPAADSDPLLLQVSVNWASDAADMRQQISDYNGPAGTNIELVCTENNSDSSSAMGRQLTSIVNGLYLADSACQLMKTEFNAYLWWDLRNGTNNTGTFDPTIYGWRTYGDEGIMNSINGVTGLYPLFYAEKLLQHFVRPGDTVLGATSDYLLLSAYAARKANGALALLVINKDATTNFNAQISLSNFTPLSTATVRSYGIAQDDAVRTNNLVPGAQDIATNVVPAGAVFTNSFPPYSLTLFTFTPGPAQLSALLPQPGQFVLQLHGQPGTPYIIQRSPDLFTWIPVSTNRLVGNVLNITNAISPGTAQQFWRAVWQP
jgi:alpha-N-arabinofuranosidase